MHRYNHQAIEKKWQSFWKVKRIYSPNLDKAKKPFYNLMMFPYPSAEGLHVGNMYAFTHSDCYGRYMRLKGYDVLEPIGLDGFGIHSENYAIKIKEHIKDVSQRTEKHFYQQLHLIGNQYDWERTVETYKENYYKWTQWLFLQMYKKGLAYRKKSPVNWCPSCKTVLSDEQVIQGECERCGSKTKKKEMKQWFFKITNYAERLLKNLSWINWSEDVKLGQKNWIGKSEGVKIKFLLNFREKMDLLDVKSKEIKQYSLKLFSQKFASVDYAVVMQNREFIKTCPLPKECKKRGWPEKDLTLKQNIKDFNWHIKDHKKKSSIAFGVFKKGLYIGRVYLFFKEELDKVNLYYWSIKKEFKNFEAVLIKEIKNWIADFTNQKQKSIEVFTTRPDTLFGATYLVLAPELLLEENNNESQGLGFLKSKIKNWKEVKKYIEKAINKSEETRKTEEKNKTGVVLEGIFAINPVNQERLPIWVADYVLKGYGTGAIMAVPAHDKRDWTFAQKFNLPVIQVVAKKGISFKSYLIGGKNISQKDLKNLGIKIIEEDKKNQVRKLEIPKNKIENYLTLIKNKLENGFWNEVVGEKIIFIFKFKNGKTEELELNKQTALKIERLSADFNDEKFLNHKGFPWKWIAKNTTYTDLVIHSEDGITINSDFLDGLETKKAKEKMTNYLIKKGVGKKSVNYKLRDWCVSRQRYWGPPIPIVYCKGKCRKKTIPITEKDLPIILPEMDDFHPDGSGKGPLNKVKSFIETQCPVCGGKAERETDVSDPFVDSSWYFFRYLSTENTQEALNKKRINKWMPIDMYLGGKEHTVLHLLYSRFITMVLYDLGYCNFEEPFKKFFGHGLLIKDGAKMSKSKGNVINPDEYIERFGADSVRMYLMFLGEINQGGDWRDTGMIGMYRFIKKLWQIYIELEDKKNIRIQDKKEKQEENEKNALSMLHKTIKSVTNDLERLSFNTAIARLMEFINWYKENKNFLKYSCKKNLLNKFAVILSPFAPHLGEEFWKKTGGKNSVFSSLWPKFKESLTIEQSIDLIVQINGKTRAKIKVVQGISENQAKNIVLKEKRLQKYFQKKVIQKIIFVQGRLINLVI